MTRNIISVIFFKIRGLKGRRLWMFSLIQVIVFKRTLNQDIEDISHLIHKASSVVMGTYTVRSYWLTCPVDLDSILFG